MEAKSSTIVVTGANGQLGRAIASALVARGAVVIATTRQQTEIRSASGTRILGPGCDLSTTQGAKALAQIVTKSTGDSFSVVNCVGYFPGYRGFLDVEYAESERIFRSNFVAVYLTALQLISPLLERGGGNFISFTSLSTDGAYPLMAAFDSSKAAVEQLTRHLSNEFSNRGLRANVLALATLKTQEEIRLKPKGDHDHWVAPEEVAGLVSDILLGDFRLMNGNIIRCYHYSPSYFGTSYFDRVST